jgi:hypothetical protein
MSKIDFINDFKDICGDIEFSTEYSCKVTSEDIITDRVNVSFKKVDRQTLIDLASETFDNVDNVIAFINKIYDQYEDMIHIIFFGYAGGAKEIYFEVREPGESSNLISYDETENKEHEYMLDDISDKAKELAYDILTKTGLVIPSVDTYFKAGWIKNDVTHFAIFEPLDGLIPILKAYSKHINSNTNELDNWLDEYSSGMLTIMGYENIDNKISLNIYTKNKI